MRQQTAAYEAMIQQVKQRDERGIRLDNEEEDSPEIAVANPADLQEIITAAKSSHFN